LAVTEKSEVRSSNDRKPVPVVVEQRDPFQMISENPENE
jgi:hypothetical protein